MIQRLGINVPTLCIVGRQGLYDASVCLQVEGDPVLKGKVKILGAVSDADLQALYTSAMFTVYPSLYEVWGLPVAESLYYGVPCITSRNTSMMEIAPDLTPFADPLITSEWVEKIRDWIEHPEHLSDNRERIKHHYQPVSWRDAACLSRDKLAVFGYGMTHHSGHEVQHNEQG